MSNPEPGVEEIAKEIATKYAPSFYRGALSLDIAKALRARDERSAGIADLWANSHSCDSHDSDPCCHVRTGKAISEAIREGKGD